MILMSIVLLVSFVLAIPLSIKGLERKTCDLEIHANCHYWYLIFVALCLMVSDLTALNSVSEINKMKTKSMIEKNKKGKCYSCFSFGFNALASATFIYELYSDFLIAWVGIFKISHLVFGFCAIVFPFINRVIFIFLSIKLLVFGVRSKNKSIKPEKLDQVIVGLNLFTVS